MAYTTISAATAVLGILFNRRFAASCTAEERANVVDDAEHAREILDTMDDSPICQMAAEAIQGALERHKDWIVHVTDPEVSTAAGSPPRVRWVHERGEFRKELEGNMGPDSDPERDYWMQWITEIELLGTTY